MSKAEVLFVKGRGRGSQWLLAARTGKIKRVGQHLGKKGRSLPPGFTLRSSLTPVPAIRTLGKVRA